MKCQKAINAVFPFAFVRSFPLVSNVELRFYLNRQKCVNLIFVLFRNVCLRAETRKVEASEHCPWCRGCGKLQSFREEACRWRLIEPLKNSSAPRAVSEIRKFSKAQTRLRGITPFGKATAWKADHRSLEILSSQKFYRRDGDVGRGLGVGWGLPVGVGVAVAVAVAVGVAVAVAVGVAVAAAVAVAVAVGVAVATAVAVAVGVGVGDPLLTAARISTRPQPYTLFGGPAPPTHRVEAMWTAE